MSESENKVMTAEDRPVAIQFDHVTKTYKLYKNDKQRFHALFRKGIPCTEVNAINDVNFTIHEREAVALFGRNGAGKSTLLKMVTQVTYPTEGEVKVNGRVSALLELTAGFDPEFTGRENIYFRGSLLGMTRKQIQEKEKKIVDFADLGEYMDQPVRTYSSGMRARLGFAINVNIDPEILIVDEALSVGDRSFRKKCLKTVSELVNEHNITFLFVTHSTRTAADFCTRGIVLRKGQVVYDGQIRSAIDYYEDMVAKEDEEKRIARLTKRRNNLLRKKKRAKRKAQKTGRSLEEFFSPAKEKRLQQITEELLQEPEELPSVVRAKKAAAATEKVKSQIPQMPDLSQPVKQRSGLEKERKEQPGRGRGLGKDTAHAQ